MLQVVWVLIIEQYNAASHMRIADHCFSTLVEYFNLLFSHADNDKVYFNDYILFILIFFFHIY